MRLLLASTLAAALAGQAIAQTGQQPPTFRAGANLVAVDVVVHDRSAKAVLDLAPADFEVMEDGKPQTVEQFYLVRGNVMTQSTAPASADALAALPPTTSAAHRTFIAVFDNDHLTPGGFKRVQEAGAALFSKDFQPGDIGGVVTGGQIVNKRLTSNREELLAAVKSVKPNGKVLSQRIELREWPSINEAEAITIARYGLRNDPTLEDAVRRACADDPSACGRVPPDAEIYSKAQRYTAEIRVSSEQTLRTLAGLMTGLERIEGRKTILLLSEGFIADATWPLVQEAVALAARANARIYSLDARGLDKGRQPIGNYAPHDDTLGNLLASFDIGADSVNSLAVDTGGYVVKNSNIFDQAVAEIASEAGTYYVLGYRSSAPLDGKFHRIAVAVKRKGVSVRARRGFVATPGPARTTEEPVKTEPAPAPAPQPSSPATESAAKPADAAPAETSAVVPVPTVPPSAPTASSATPVPPGMRMRPDAVKHTDVLVSKSPTAPDASAQAGWEAYQRGDLESARASLSAAASTESARPWVHYALGQANYGLRLYREAVTEWEKVLAAAPEFEPVYFDLVDGCLQIKDYDRATRAIRAAAARWPKDADVFNALGVVQVARGAIDDAIKSFGEAVAVAPGEGVGYYNLARAHELRYARSRRYVSTTRTWVVSKSDYDAAVANYSRYLGIGGPFDESAREALTRLGWSPPQ